MALAGVAGRVFELDETSADRLVVSLLDDSDDCSWANILAGLIQGSVHAKVKEQVAAGGFKSIYDYGAVKENTVMASTPPIELKNRQAKATLREILTQAYVFETLKCTVPIRKVGILFCGHELYDLVRIQYSMPKLKSSLHSYVCDGGCSAPELYKIVYDVFNTIEQLKRAGMVHGDLKCDNILLGKNDAVKLIDFGCAKTMALGHDKQHVQLSTADLFFFCWSLHGLLMRKRAFPELVTLLRPHLVVRRSQLPSGMNMKVDKIDLSRPMKPGSFDLPVEGPAWNGWPKKIVYRIMSTIRAPDPNKSVAEAKAAVKALVSA